MYVRLQMFLLPIQKFEGSRHEVLHDIEQNRAREVVEVWINTMIT